MLIIREQNKIEILFQLVKLSIKLLSSSSLKLRVKQQE